jgi:acyl carrier protein
MISMHTMSQEECKQLILKHLREIAPEEDVATLRPHDDICESLEIDKLEFHDFLRALGRDVGVDIPDQDASHVNTIDRLAKYLVARMQPA